MKSLKEIRGSFDLTPREGCSRVKYFKTLDIDWDVYLPTRGRNLQRDFVWTLEQKRELMWSLLTERHIPHCAVINTINQVDEKKDKWLIIDGKQRLSTIFDFVDDKFTIVLEGEEYKFSELPEDYRSAIIHHEFRYYEITEPWNKRITDDQKIQWFKMINFAGTQQELEHLNNL